MNIMLVSQCSKQALPGTRRILDQFAERKGSRTWLTPITEAGLKTLHVLLRKQARKNTAVACHCIRSNRLELLWVVGNRRKFDRHGNVPTDTRTHSVLSDIREDGWQHTEAIALLAAIAGLFHDFGKANDLFQRKLTDSKAPKSEPIRHEWLSVRLFEAFVDSRSDNEWLEELKNIDSSKGAELVELARKDGLQTKCFSPLHKMNQPVARAVAWLILTHHRLPFTGEPGEGQGNEVEKWPRKLRPHWNSPQFGRLTGEEDFEKLWKFSKQLPIASETWRKRAKSLAERGLSLQGFTSKDWFQDTFCMHLARCALMLADHSYSSGEVVTKWQDKKYTALANTRWSDATKTVERVPHQRLDEHCIGVAHFAWLFAKSIPRLRSLLPAVGDVRALKKNSAGKFNWQNKAYSLAKQSAQHSGLHGGFFINMASTGTGKTLANARMAYALNELSDGCRFSVLLGLRTLTLQTGDALRQRTGLGSEELGVLVGSSAVRELHERAQASVGSGSESSEELVGVNDHVYYDGELTQSKFGSWLGTQRKSTLLKLLSSPVLVSTIDYMMPATESDRGGHQIAPMLRLLSSDIVLDEPDDFGLADQPALCRLVYWAGMLGSRLILSSATLSPALLEALFTAYYEGRREFNQATASENRLPIVCGWVDEYSAIKEFIKQPSDFVLLHNKFVEKRLGKLRDAPLRRKAALFNVDSDSDPDSALAKTILQGVLELHLNHHETLATSSKTISVGLVRMANINSMISVFKQLIALEIPENTDINLCLYHSRHPLLRRHLLEKNLDTLLNRTDSSAIWRHESVLPVLNRKAEHQIFVVFATAVAEVGRDHCYDWAVVEPSSMRSIVQLAGRVLRHRECKQVDKPNLLLLRHNFRSLQGKEVCFEKPGYESKTLKLVSHDLEACLPADHYQHPGSASCIQEPIQLYPETNLVDLEHTAMRAVLLSAPDELWPASLWWRQSVRWCYQMQANTRFRKGIPTQMVALVTDDERHMSEFQKYGEGEWKPAEGEFERDEALVTSSNIHWWLSWTDAELAVVLEEEMDDELSIACRRMLVLELEKLESAAPSRWRYHYALGVYREI